VTAAETMKRSARAAPAALVALAVGASVQALPPEDAWLEVRTPHFTLLSSGDGEKARRMAADLERLRDVLPQVFPSAALDSPVPTYILVFKDAGAFAHYRFSWGGALAEAGGYFLSTPIADYVAIDGAAHDARPLLYHEYLHYVLHNRYPRLPAWLHEGLAEYYGTFEVDGEKGVVGLPEPARIEVLRDRPLIPLARLFAGDSRSPEYLEPTARHTFYAESWALVHYLLSGNPDRRRQLTEYLRLAETGAPHDRIFPQAFATDPGTLEGELGAYLRGSLFDYTNYTNYTRVLFRLGTGAVAEARPVPRADVLYRLGSLLEHIDGRAGVAAEHFRAALAERPVHAPAMAGLGNLAERAERREEARSWYEKALQLAPDDPFVQYLYGRFLLREPGPESVRAARAALSRAAQLRPGFGEAWALLGWSYALERRPPPEAVQALEAAHRLLPARADVALNLAATLAGREDVDGAIAVLEPLVAILDDPAQLAEAAKLLDRLKKKLGKRSGTR
jgi:Flp pilus assembly protein TadD